MTASISIIKQSMESITLEITIPFSRSMIDSENSIQDAVNGIGSITTRELLKTFDTEGEDIRIGSVNMTSKGLINKAYQTPYGEVEVARYIYQTSAGGATFCPLEREARIVLASTPRFASQVSHKMAEMAAPGVQRDLKLNHNRNVSIALLQRLTEVVAAVVQAKEEAWSYKVPEIKEADIASVSIGLDGTCMLMCNESYRQAMVGTIALYDNEGERQHTTYIAAAPEYGKDKFKERLAREIQRATKLYPKAIKIGLADGAHDNWEFLEKYTDKQTVDFYHASEYLSGVADNVFSMSTDRKAWLDDRCHQLKHMEGAASAILAEMQGFENSIASGKPILWIPSPPTNNKTRSLKQTQAEQVKSDPRPYKHKGNREQMQKSLSAAITYFTNNNAKSRMEYAASIEANYPIGSGVTEAACKTIVKQRLCKSGMQWKDKGAGVILSLRALICSTGRWTQFWQKVNQFGVPSIA